MKYFKDWIDLEMKPEDGFWKSYTEKTLLECAKVLHKKGVDKETIKDVISSVYYAACEEYGG